MRTILAGWTVVIAGLGFAVSSCTTGVEPSPAPGIIRVTIQSDDNDSSIVILSDTTRYSRYDQFLARVYDARLYRGDNYSPLYVTMSPQRIQSDTVNLLGREWLDGSPITIRDSITITPSNSRYRRYTIFEWFVPPGTYDELEFSLIAGEVVTYIPKLYNNPIQLPPGTKPGLFFSSSITVQENTTTQVDIVIAPFKSLTDRSGSAGFRSCERPGRRPECYCEESKDGQAHGDRQSRPCGRFRGGDAFLLATH
jgi:hypothetical protein